ncbi:MAG: hypothetical protein JWO11_4322 [Nocardioides sp.]|nr:hypothetical protein [Nocardioides sp.]
MKTPARYAAALLLATAVPVLGAGAAQARADGDVIRTGSCSGATDWKIKAKPDNGRIEVEAEIDSNHNGQTWKWVLRHEGNVVARGTSTTSGPSGSFDVQRRTNNAAGSDSFKFRAVNQKGGETCVARVTL